MSAFGTAWLGMFSQQTWTKEALCPETDPEIFFPEKGGSTAAAKQICVQCPVRQSCLDWALENDETFGIFGGYSARERWRLKRGEGVPLAALKDKAKTTGQCGWCGVFVRGDRMYCDRSCSSNAFRDRAARKGDAA